MDRSKLIEKLLYIDNKRGQVVPFKFNKLQRYFYTHKSNRNIILKHRQGGCCLDPSTLILTSDLRWISIDNVQVGDVLVGVDEFPNAGKGKPRHFRKTEVLEKIELEEEAYLIETDEGNIIATGNHRFLSSAPCGSFKKWRTIDEPGLGHKGRLKVGCHIRVIVKPWGEPSYEDGWFGGVLDGEGSISKGRCQLSIAQLPGAVMDRCKRYVGNRYHYFYTPESSGQGFGRRVDHLQIYSPGSVFEIIGKCRPSRFINRTDWWENKGLNNGMWGTIVAIIPLGKRRVLDIETSTGTFIANGFVSHNSSGILADMFIDCITIPHTPCAVVSHETHSTQRLLDRVQFYYDTMESPKPALGAESRSEKTFPELHSSIYIGTAGARAFGHGDTVRKALMCLHPDSLVLISGGRLKRIAEIQPLSDPKRPESGDRTYSAKRGKLISVLGVSSSPCSGIMIKATLWGNPSTPLMATPDHRVLTGRSPNSWKSLSEAKYIASPIRPITNKRKSVGLTQRGMNHQSKILCDRFIYFNYDFGWIVGLFLAEGSYMTQGIHFSLSPEELGYSDRVILFANKYGANTSVKVEDTRGVIGGREVVGKVLCNVVYSTPLKNLFLKMLGRDKVIPDWFWDCGEEFLNGVIDGYEAGDGHKTLRGCYVTSVRPWLLYQLRELKLSTRKEYSSIAYSEKRKGWVLYPLTGYKGQRRHKHIRFSTIRGLSYVFVGIRKKEEFPYAGLMYDIQTRGSFQTPCGIVHNSELSLYEDGERILNGVEDAVPFTGELTIESTPYGEDNIFYRRWTRAKEGKSSYKPFFFPWWWSEDYTIPRGSELVIPIDRDELSYTGEELELIERHHLTEEQIRWRRWKIGEKEGLFWQEFPEDEVSCFITVGDPVFDQFILTNLAQSCYNGEHHPQGWTFWMKPEEKMRYVIGADSSPGAPGGSYSAAVVLNDRWEVCSTFQARLEPHIFAGILKQMGIWYNGAEIAIERNFTGYAVLGHLNDYGNIYHQRDFLTGKVTSNLGWWTNDQTKQYMMTATKDHLSQLKLWDVNLVRQLRGYRYIKFRPTAQTFDDLAIALMIAISVRKVSGTARGFQGAIKGWNW